MLRVCPGQLERRGVRWVHPLWGGQDQLCPRKHLLQHLPGGLQWGYRCPWVHGSVLSLQWGGFQCPPWEHQLHQLHPRLFQWPRLTFLCCLPSGVLEQRCCTRLHTLSARLLE